MLRDLSTAETQSGTASADVVVVGAGLAGLVLASRLGRAGLRVVVLESGGKQQEGDTHPLNEVVQSKQIYSGAEAGRFRCLGGTSTRWGGAMLPFLPCDIGRHTAGWDVDWPVSFEELAREFEELETTFQLPSGAFEPMEVADPTASGQAFRLRSAKWPSFKYRNAAYVFQEDIQGEHLEVWLNAHVTRFRMDGAGRLAEVTAISPAGHELQVRAPTFVFAAGAIESTRLLLLMDAQHDNKIFTPDGVLGRYFYDHLTAPAGVIEPADRGALNAAYGMRFQESGMRDRRLEPSEALRLERELPGAFAHVVPISQGNDGFAALRSIYRDIQRRVPAKPRDIGAVVRDIGWFSRAVWWRFGKRRLLAPDGARFDVHLNIEQRPSAENAITLAPGRVDRYGNALAQIEWQVLPSDVEAFRVLQAALVEYWAQSENALLGTLTPTPEDIWKSRLQEAADIYHPGGSTRIGTDRTNGVVNADLKSFHVENVYVVSTSAFPSGGSANPSFMLMAFALRAAKQIAAATIARPTVVRSSHQSVSASA